ncbi:transmembrane protein, putative [Medicago truncatula]|uniref:Transmembrane protein, putative n=1 Tax=Medicago truncatula TaxID=3880 RepID=A0A072V675_MEDTR|nr:transmembrane protein, putative [Medicago truncatula]
MVSGLKINFFKSSLIGVNVETSFMDMACNFLNCSEGSLPFKYLGLPVGANSRSMSTWEPLVENLSGRLNTWGHKYISFGGRIVLVNAVLNVIPIFYLSLLKLPVQVWKRIVRIQREFLWGGVGGGNKISWVKWETVCQSKRNGGLGVKDIRLMNVSLLAKWRWRLIDGDTALWKEALRAKYGIGVDNLLVGGFIGAPRLGVLA